MTGRTRGLLLGLAQVALVLAVGGRYLLDRGRLPRVWVRTVPVDPDLPIRGRYVRLWLTVDAGSVLTDPEAPLAGPVRIEPGAGGLVALPSDAPGLSVRRVSDTAVVLEPPVAFFIPEHVPDPSVRAAGEELWVEVSVPAEGSPRPVRLGVRRGGEVRPLELR